jgi:hypothetical protein
MSQGLLSKAQQSYGTAVQDATNLRKRARE